MVVLGLGRRFVYHAGLLGLEAARRLLPGRRRVVRASPSRSRAGRHMAQSRICHLRQGWRSRVIRIQGWTLVVEPGRRWCRLRILLVWGILLVWRITLWNPRSILGVIVVCLGHCCSWCGIGRHGRLLGRRGLSFIGTLGLLLAAEDEEESKQADTNGGHASDNAANDGANRRALL